MVKNHRNVLAFALHLSMVSLDTGNDAMIKYGKQ